MIRPSARSLCLAAILLGPAATFAQGLSADELKAYGGSYAVECANPAGPRLNVGATALDVERGGQRLSGRNPMASASFFGASPPRDFQVALLSEVRGGGQMMFIVFADKAGRYITIDAEPKVRAALGATLLKPRYRSCEAAPPRPAPAALLPTAPTTSDAAPDIGALLASPVFKRAYLSALGAKAGERWLARLEGPAPPTRREMLDGTPYIVVAICKPHDCSDHNAVFLYSVEQRRVIGLLQQAGTKTLVGGATPLQGRQLDKLWQAEWRLK